MRRLSLVAAFLFAACSTSSGPLMSELQDRCEAEYPVFQEMTGCLKKQAIANMAEHPDFDLIDIYITKAEKISEALDIYCLMLQQKDPTCTGPFAQKIDKDARLELAYTLAKLKSIAAERARKRRSQALKGFGQGLTNASAAMGANQPTAPTSPSSTTTIIDTRPGSTQTNCQWLGTSMHCITY